MATIQAVLDLVDEIKPNAFSNETKTHWLSEIEGTVQTEVMLLAPAEIIQYSYAADAQTELLAAPPHDRLYWAYLSAMVDFANGEYRKYQNTMQMFNTWYGEYMRWYADHYRPADGRAMAQGYYLSAYAIACKHGFEGTEAEWLASLKGEPGGNIVTSGVVSVNGQTGEVQLDAAKVGALPAGVDYLQEKYFIGLEQGAQYIHDAASLRWAGTPTHDDDLANKGYVDGLQRVRSVNGRTGDITLFAGDVNALPAVFEDGVWRTGVPGSAAYLYGNAELRKAEAPTHPHELVNKAYVDAAAGLNVDALMGELASNDALMALIVQRAQEMGLGVSAAAVVATSLTELRDGWFFTKGSETSTVSLPHTYNMADGLTANYYKGDTEYTKTVTLSSASRYFLIVEGAGQKSTVYLDDVMVKAYKGGYTHYLAELPQVAEGVHTIKIRCNNAKDLENIPISADFNFNNGLHKRVWLLSLGTAGFDAEAYGQDRFHLVQDDISSLAAQFTVKTKVQTYSERDLLLRFTLLDGSGSTVITDDTETVATGDSFDYSKQFTLPNPHLWHGKRDPYLYTARLELYKDDTLIDSVSEKIGFRFYSLDADNGFLLNSESYPLRGVCLHQDTAGHMSAMTDADFDTDYALVDEIGATVVRLAHYPHARYAYRKCDELGLIVQTEIPWVNNCDRTATDAYFETIKANMASMIKNYYNHPSIVFWGMNNELSNATTSTYDYAKAKVWTEELYNFAKALDPDRLIGFVSCEGTFKSPEDAEYNTRFSNPSEWNFVDWIGTNLYKGWYGGTFQNFGTTLARYRSAFPFWAVSEYGAGANPNTHSDNPEATTDTGTGGARHDEEYQNLFHEAHIEQIQAHPWLIFTTIWIMFDFAVAGRNEGGIPYLNDKGLVTRDRQTRKDSFYLYKAAWNSEPMVYITSRRMAKRTGPNVAVKVYANTDTLTLTVDGVAVQTMNAPTAAGVVWQFDPVALADGEHTFAVSGIKGGQNVSDTVTWPVEEPPAVIEPLAITVQPEDQTVEIGSTATLTVQAEGGIQPYTYRWQYYDTGSSKWKAASGTNNDGSQSTFMTTTRTEQNSGTRYRCLVNDAGGAGVTSEEAVVTAVPASVAATDFSLHADAAERLQHMELNVLPSVAGEVKITPSDANAGTAIQWQLTPAGMGTVTYTDGVLTFTALSAGTATLRGTLANGISHEYQVAIAQADDALRVVYDFTDDDFPLTPKVGTHTNAIEHGAVTYTSTGVYPTVKQGDGGIEVPLASVGIAGREIVQVTLDFGAFRTETINDERLFAFCSTTENILRIATFSSSGTETYGMRTIYKHGTADTTKYNTFEQTFRTNSARMRLVISFNVETQTATLRLYHGSGLVDKGAFTAPCDVSSINRLIIANSPGFDRALPIEIRGCEIIAY